MVVEQDFRIWAELPEEAYEGIPFSGKIIIQNKSKETSPEFRVVATFVWSEIHPRVEANIVIPELKADEKFTMEFEREPLTGGWMGILLNSYRFSTGNHQIWFHNQAGMKLEGDIWFAAIRAKSIEEQLQEELIQSLRDSTESQDRLVKTQNRLAKLTLYWTIVQAFVGIFSVILAWLAITK